MSLPVDPDVVVHYLATRGFTTRKNIEELVIENGSATISREDKVRDLEKRFLAAERCPIPGGRILSVYKPLKPTPYLTDVEVREALEVNTRLRGFASSVPLSPSVIDPDAFEVEDDTKEVPFVIVLFVKPPNRAKARSPGINSKTLLEGVRNGPTRSQASKSAQYNNIQANSAAAVAD
ncbi:hypothetical protein PM082_023893 [Marasmius tenuissimus]|nr:hypothetical protein PM082_023893 [Marasmius tenuissimus]